MLHPPGISNMVRPAPKRKSTRRYKNRIKSDIQILQVWLGSQPGFCGTCNTFLLFWGDGGTGVRGILSRLHLHKCQKFSTTDNQIYFTGTASEALFQNMITLQSQ